MVWRKKITKILTYQRVDFLQFLKNFDYENWVWCDFVHADSLRVKTFPRFRYSKIKISKVRSLNNFMFYPCEASGKVWETLKTSSFLLCFLGSDMFLWCCFGGAVVLWKFKKISRWQAYETEVCFQNLKFLPYFMSDLKRRIRQ